MLGIEMLDAGGRVQTAIRRRWDPVGWRWLWMITLPSSDVGNGDVGSGVQGTYYRLQQGRAEPGKVTVEMLAI
jgi:hypothetical protein